MEFTRIYRSFFPAKNGLFRLTTLSCACCKSRSSTSKVNWCPGEICFFEAWFVCSCYRLSSLHLVPSFKNATLKPKKQLTYCDYTCYRCSEDRVRHERELWKDRQTRMGWWVQNLDCSTSGQEVVDKRAQQPLQLALTLKDPDFSWKTSFLDTNWWWIKIGLNQLGWLKDCK